MLEEWFSEIKGAVISKVQELIEQNETGEKDLDKFLEEDLEALRVAAVAQMPALDEESLKLKKKSGIFLGTFEQVKKILNHLLNNCCFETIKVEKTGFGDRRVRKSDRRNAGQNIFNFINLFYDLNNIYRNFLI